MHRKNRIMMTTAAATGLMLLALTVGNGLAGSARDHELARQALESGQILPLRRILELVEHNHPGQIMEIELESKEAGWRYEVKLLQADGALVKIKLDARDGSILSIKDKKY